jgi:PAS domain S-box-containing protein
MNKPLHCLIVEDSENDALLVVRQLRTGDYDVTWERVETAEAMRAALGRQRWDIVIADYQMPRFSGLAALELLKASGKGLPFIIVSGTIGEDQAVAAMKTGAHDYIMKGKLARLVPAVERELREAVEWRARRRAEVALQESEQKYRELVEHANSIILRWTRDGRITFLNEFGQKFFGYPAAEILGRHVVGTIVPDSESTSRDLRTLLDQIGTHPEVFAQSINENMRRNGERVWVVWTNKVVLDELGQTKEILSIGSDITERKQAEEALKREQALFTDLVSTIPDQIYFKDRKSRFVRINDSMARRFGLRSPDEAVGKTDFDVFSEEHARQAYEDEQRIMSTGDPLIGLVEKETWPDGHVTWVSSSKVPLRDGQGNITGLVGISRDITERKRAEERNREQAALLDNANDAIYVVSLDHTILYWNRGAERIYGWTSGEVLNRKTTELIFHDHAVLEALNPVLFKQGSWSGERRQIAKSGGMVEVFSRLTLVRNEQGQPQSVFVIDTDITEKKQLAAQFLRAQRLESIGALASGIAHDLNNVLAPIIMGAPLLQRMVKDQTALHLLKTMESSAQRGAAIVRQVLTFARGVEGERVPLQPRHLLSEMERLAAETFPKGIRVESDVAADLWPVQGDATQLHQALMNLCINARDAMPGGGVLTLEAANIVLSKEAAEKIPGAQPGSFACLRVTDTGTGIPPEIEAKIFEPFFTTKGMGKGTGLGLSTVLGIVRSHGGFVRVASKVGKGTTFELYLPATAVGQVAVKKDSATPWPRAHGEGILVVDDEAAIREVARQALVEFGYLVITSGSGTEALRIFQERRHEIQLVMTDMMMPEMDGPTLVAALRVLDPAVKIVGITGMSDTTGMSGLKTLALSAMLAKPFTIGKLLAVIHEALPVTAGDKSAAPAGGGSRPAPG